MSYESFIRPGEAIQPAIACGAVLEGGHTEAEYDALPDPLFAECHTDAHNRALLAAANAENIALTGYGVIEGNGPDFYEKKILPCGFYQRKQVERPRMLHFANCRNILLINSSPTTYNVEDYKYTCLLSKDAKSHTRIVPLLTRK